MSKIVLTAERTLMSDYNGALFLGFMSTGPSNLIPQRLFFKLVCPPVPEKDGRVVLAPYGTRKIEAALLESGFSEDDVKIVNPDRIHRHITKETKIVGITTNDPLGLGPASTTFSGETGFVNNPSYNRMKFEELLRRLRKFDVKIVVGGPGAWQLENEAARKRLGIDVVVVGEGEKVVPDLFRKILNGEKVPEVVYGKAVPENEIPRIRGATIGGLVEISRGCGRGCKFCVPTMRRLRSRPLEDILYEAKAVVEGGKDIVTLHAEDVLRYKARGFNVNREEVLRLFEEVHRIAKNVGISHFALSSVASAPEVVERISEILEIPNERQPWLAGQTGIETGSHRLIEKYMPGKAKPFSPNEWRDVVTQAFQICSDANWVPCATIIMGFPEETEDDVVATMELIEELKDYKSLIVPLFFVPANEMAGERFSVHKMRRYHWELVLACWRHNVRWLKPLAKEYLDKMPAISRMFMNKFIDWVVRKASKKVEEYILERMETCPT